MSIIIFRCDASTAIGSGHVMRCLTLANHMKNQGWTCVFACSPETLKSAPALGVSGYEVVAPNILKSCDVMVVDHYGLSASDETAFRKCAKKIIVIDDLADRRHDCDVLVDTTYGRAVGDYQPLVPENAIILTGADYALLRPDFQALRENALTRRDAAHGKIKRILITMGGADPDNVTAKILDSVRQANLAITVDVVAGGGNPHLESLRRQIKSMGPDIHFHVNTPDMAALMAQADLAIGAGGTTSWERACLGLPTLLIEIADNQKTIAANLHAQGAVINLGWHENIAASDIARALQNLFQNPAQVMLMSQKARLICSGEGAARIERFILA